MPLELVWLPLAGKRLQQIRVYVAKDKPQAAERLAIRIVAMVEVLRRHPYIGRRGSEPGFRELVIGGTPYIVIYRVTAKRIMVSNIWHGAQQRPSP